MTGRIDTHCHVIPPAYAAWLDGHPLFHDRPQPRWSADAHLALYDAFRVDTGILSVTMPGVWLGPGTDPSETATWARRVNEFCADLVREHPSRFGFFATLTLPDVDRAIVEARFALTELSADGIVLLSNTDGSYLGCPEWDPLFEALDDMAAVVFVHPTRLPAPLVPGVQPGVVDFLADTTRAAVTMLFNGYLTRFPRLRIILSHGGGYVPYAAARIASMSPEARGREREHERLQWGLAELRKYYYDTALVGGPALATLLDFADPGHLTYGSDFPFAAPTKTAHFTRLLDTHATPDELMRRVNRENALQLFPRLAARER